MRGMVVGRGGGILMEVVLVVVVMLILPSWRDLVWRSCVTHVATAAPVPLHSRSFVWMDISVIVIHVHTPFFWYLVINITKNHFIFLSYENFTVNRHEAILLQHQLTFQCFQNSAYLWCCSQLPSWQRWTSPLHRPHHFLMRCVACTDRSFLFHWLISLPLPLDSWILLYLSFQEVFYNNSNPFRNFYRIKINNKPTS